MEYSAAVKSLASDLIEFNPNLTGEQAFDYAIRIMTAEIEEDYFHMNALLQEASFGPETHKTAA